MGVDELLTEIEPLTHRERCRRLVAAVRDIDLDDLGGRGPYERSLALFLAAAVRDKTYLAQAMREQDAELAGWAIRLAVELGVPAAAIRERLADAPTALRTQAYRAILRAPRQDLAEQLIDEVAEQWGAEPAAALLPACGADVAAERLPGLAHAVPNWASFGRAHPGVLLDHAERELAELPEGQLILWWLNQGHAIAAAARAEPGRVVGLLERHLPPGSLPSPLRRVLGVLLDAEPDRMLRLLLAAEHRASLGELLRRRAVRDRLAKRDGLVAEVARAVREDDQAVGLLLKAFPPSRREQVFEAAMAGVDRTAVELCEDLLELLPAAVRAREARRMLALRKVTESTHRTWELTGFLPYDEALPVLREVTRRADAAERAWGYRHLISCAGRSRDPAVFGRLLDALDRLRNDQEPVRQAALDKLARVPAVIFRPEHLPALSRLVGDALNAPDISYGVVDALRRLAAAVGTRPEQECVVFAFETYARLAGHAGAFYLAPLNVQLRHGQEHDLLRALSPRLTEAARRDDHRLALTLARTLGRRAHELPQLQDKLELALTASDDAVIKQAIELWLAPPRTRGERVAQVVDRDPSTATLPAVFGVLARRRTDLLSLVLYRQPLTGRFWSEGVTYVPMARHGWIRRWTAAQRTAYLALLRRLADDAGAHDKDRAQAVVAIGRVPGVEAAELARYLDSDEVFLRRAAFRAAPWIGSPQDILGALLDHATSDDAHVAVYAAGRAARFVPPSMLGTRLATTLTEGKVTARKEALRILLHNRVPGAPDLIARAWDEPRQHPDVRAAIVSAIRGRLAEPQARRILTEAADGPPEVARQVVGAMPLHVADQLRADYAELVLRVARSSDPETRDSALNALPWWAPWHSGIPPLLAAIATDLRETRSWRSALYALVTCAVNGVGPAELRSAATALAAAPPEPDAEAERDLPARQRLSALASFIRQQACQKDVEHALTALDGALPEPLASELLAATQRWNDAEALDALADRRIGGVLAVERVAEALSTGPSKDIARGFVWRQSAYPVPEPEQVFPHAARLAARHDLTGGLFACALADHHGERAGWPPEWRELLRGLRAHAHPDVAYAAQAIHTASE